MRQKKTVLTLVFIVLMSLFGMAVFSNTGENLALVSSLKSTYTVVIDPGHGGFDGGAVGKDGTAEKDINLAISLELQRIMKDYGIEVIMTRDCDKSLNGDGSTGSKAKTEDIKTRAKIIAEANPDLTISIHLNSYPSDASVYGAQVFYSYNEQKRTIAKTHEQLSKNYGENVQKSLETSILDGRERKAMSKNDTYLLKHVRSPFILVECGFLSNNDECQKLKRADYQRLLAKAIWDGINTSLCLERTQKIHVIQSSNKG